MDSAGSIGAQPSDATVPPVRVTSETGPLERVVIGYPDSFVMPEPINLKHTIYHHAHPKRPTREKLKPEFDRFRVALESRGVDVIQPQPVPGVPDQLTPRDIGFVIDDVFVVASMATACRRNEWEGIQDVIDGIPADRVLRAPDDVVVEGGDVVLDRGTLFIGRGGRTTEAGVEFLRRTFGDRYRVEAVPLKGLDDGEDVLHLDCAFVPVGERHALVYPDGLAEIPAILRDDYEWIVVDRDEQFQLATNVLSISPTTVISRAGADRVNAELRAAGLEVIELQFDETPKSGGSFRCASLPLLRGDSQGAGA